jgi:hypothetical protein
METIKSWPLVAIALAAAAGSASAADLRRCGAADLMGHEPSSEAVDANRRFDKPTLHYPFGTKIEMWQFRIVLRVDESGAVTCFDVPGRFSRPQPLTPQREALLDTLAQWRYTPFERDGRILSALVSEWVGEEEDPATHVPAPVAAAADVEFTLERTGCFGTCPAYRVTVRGDGSAEYEGGGFVDVTGKHAFAVPSEGVASLVAQAARDDLWSTRESYAGPITDQPSYILTMRVGATTHRIEDYAGSMAGMPGAVSAMEDAIDRLAHMEQWLELSSTAVDRLDAEGFDFTSREAGEMLARAVDNAEGHDDAAMVRLVERGAPLLAPQKGYRDPDEPIPGPDSQALLRSALEQGHTGVVDAILVRAPLPRGREARQEAIDAAFGAALRGGKLESIERAWSLDPRVRPSPTATVTDDDKKPQRIPACLQLGRAWPRTGPWNGVAIVKWLETHGCDVVHGRGLHGDTFLHLAADLGDVALTRWLLERGVDPNAQGEFALPALGSAKVEDVAMLLLEAGTDLSAMDDGGKSFRHYAVENNHWARVSAWLDAHRR